jgi:hypothetical protein
MTNQPSASAISDERLALMLESIEPANTGGDLNLFNADGARLPFKSDTLTVALTELAALRSAPAPEWQGMPKGWKLVPEIETDFMCEEGLEALRENLGHEAVIMRDAAACYRAMVRNAPSPPPRKDQINEPYEVFEAVRAAYERGYNWGQENPDSRPFLNKAAYDYADKTTSALALTPPAPSKVVEAALRAALHFIANIDNAHSSARKIREALLALGEAP